MIRGGAEKERTMTVKWRMNGIILGMCSCDWGCPCNFDARPTQGICEGGYLWHIDEGEFGGVSLAGLNMAWFAHAPGPMHEGNVTGQTIYDERATPQQREALSKVDSGKFGGPWTIFAAVMSKRLDPLVAPFEFKAAELNSSARVGKYAEVALGPVMNPVTNEAEQLYLDKPTGFTSTRAALGRSLTFRVNAGLKYDHSGKYGEFSHFSYSGEGES
jgi:hypothetical protein